MTATARLGAGRYVDPGQIPEGTVTTAHQLSTHDGATVTGLLRVAGNHETVVVLMHPRQDFSHHVLVPELLGRGYSVWTQGTRSVGNDLRLLHEEAVLDLAAGVAFLREEGFGSVVLIGHSGGGALSAFYIEQSAADPAVRVSVTPGGRPVPLPEADLPRVDGLMLMAPHPGQGELLQRLIDPSVADESDPMSVDPELDPFSEVNGFAVPPASSNYSPEFIAAYRAAQVERVRRIDDLARNLLAESGSARRDFAETHDVVARRRSLATPIMTVYRTDADLRCMDLSLDRNDRPYGSLFGRRPDLTNFGIVGFCRVTTPEAWLSTWSATTSNAGMVRCARSVDVPTLLVELTGDQACFPRDAEDFVAAIAHEDVTHLRVPGLHFGAALSPGGPTGAARSGAEMAAWLDERFGR